MKRLVLVLISLLTLTGTAAAGGWRDLNTDIEKSGMDDVLHFAAGAGAAFLVDKLADGHMSTTQKVLLGVTVPIIIGTIKELTDKNFDPMDIAGYAVGGAFTVPLVNVNF